SDGRLRNRSWRYLQPGQASQDARHFALGDAFAGMERVRGGLGARAYAMRRRAKLIRRDLWMATAHLALAPAAGADLDPIGFDLRLRGWRDFGVGDDLFGLFTEFATASGAIGLSHRHVHRRRAGGFFRRRRPVIEWPSTRFTSGTFRILLALVFAEGR